MGVETVESSRGIETVESYRGIESSMTTDIEFNSHNSKQHTLSDVRTDLCAEAAGHSSHKPPTPTPAGEGGIIYVMSTEVWRLWGRAHPGGSW